MQSQPKLHHKYILVGAFITLLVLMTHTFAAASAHDAALLENAAQQTMDAGTGPDSGPFAPGQVVVKYKDRKDASASIHAAPETAARRTALRAIPGAFVLQVAVGSELQMVSALRRDPTVEYCELNYRASALDEPDDALWSQQWALHRIQASAAWDVARCEGTVVAILDTGVFQDHPDLSNVLWTNVGEIPGNGIDDDENDKIDDVHGWHFYQNCTNDNCQPYENHLIEDENGHGTHVTGIAAAQTNNGLGIAGVSRGGQAMIVKVLDRYGDGYYSDIAAGIRYAADNGAQVINLSLGGDQPSRVLQDAVDYAYNKGVLVVAATGNDGGAVLYPAACDRVMAVAATDEQDQRPAFSNYGPQVDIAAPGQNIISTWRPPYYYFQRRGTSMAAPHVAGAAALLRSWRPDYTNDQTQERLQSCSDDVNASTLPGHDSFLGWGRLNLACVFADLPPGPTPTPPPVPTPIATPTPRICETRLLLIFKQYRANP